MIKSDEATSDIALELDIIKMNSGNYCIPLFIIDAKMRAYEIGNRIPVRVTSILDGIKIKDISCTDEFTVFLSKCGRVFGMGSNFYGKLGLSRRIRKTEIPTEITFPNLRDSDKNKIIITMIYASMGGWVSVDSQQRTWIVGDKLMQSVRSDFSSLGPCVDIVEVWHFNEIKIVQIKCGWSHVIALDTKGRVYWFGDFTFSLFFYASSDPIPFSHRITSIKSGFGSVALKDATNEWYIWGWNSNNHITGLCGCEAVCKKNK